MSRSAVSSILAVSLFLWPHAGQAREWDRDFDRMDKAVHRFAGRLQGPYMQVYPPLVADQIMDGLSGPSDPVTDLPGGSQLISGCRAHSCDEKAAVILGPGHQVQAAAVISARCHWTRPPHRTRKGNLNGPSKCDADHDILTIFLRRSAQSDALKKALLNWGQAVDPKPMVHFAPSDRPQPLPSEVVWLK